MSASSTRESLFKNMRKIIVTIALIVKLIILTSLEWVLKLITTKQAVSLSLSMTKTETKEWSEKEKESQENNWKHWSENLIETQIGQKTPCLRFQEKLVLVKLKSISGVGTRKERSMDPKQLLWWWLAAVDLRALHLTNNQLSPIRILATKIPKTYSLILLIIAPNQTIFSPQITIRRLLNLILQWYHSLIPKNAKRQPPKNNWTKRLDR